MPHIHTDPGQHDHTVSAYIIRTDFAEPKIMLHKHRIIGKWLQFGGHVELNENPWDAICHEIPEETGFEMDQLQIMQPRDRITTMDGNQVHPVPMTHFTHPFTGQDHYHTDTGFLFITDQPPKNHIDKSESQEIELFTLEELKNLPDLVGDIVGIFEFANKVGLKKWEALPTSTFN